MLQRKPNCLEGRHMPRATSFLVDASQGDPNLLHTSCSQCGRLLVKSLLTRRWRQTGMMG